MTPNQIQTLIENLRVQTAANSINPDMLATILTHLNRGATNVGTNAIESLPLLYCEVIKGKLYLRNNKYYEEQGYVPILFRYTRWRNRIDTKKRRGHGPRKKGWHANGKVGTIKVDGDGLIQRSTLVLNSYKMEAAAYSNEAAIFVNHGDAPKHPITWGTCKIDKKNPTNGNNRMIRLPFAIAYAKPTTNEVTAVTLADIASNLAPFFVRGSESGDGYRWFFSR